MRHWEGEGDGKVIYPCKDKEEVVQRRGVSRVRKRGGGRTWSPPLNRAVIFRLGSPSSLHSNGSLKSSSRYVSGRKR